MFLYYIINCIFSNTNSIVLKILYCDILKPELIMLCDFNITAIVEFF